MAILFKNDWLKYPTAIVDYQTTNQSFKRLVSLYKKMGIDNCEWPLALLQPDLQGVDPFSEDLTTEQKVKINLEAKYNPWYYFRELARLPPTGGAEPIRFVANRGNMSAYWCFFNHIDYCLVQPRQTHKSGSMDLLNVGILDIWGTNLTSYLVTKSSKLLYKTVAQIKEARYYLPDYIYTPNKNDGDNKETLNNSLKKTLYSTAVGRSDPVAADALGRGLAVPVIQFDEVAYILNIAKTLPVALASGGEARDLAAAAGQLYGNIFTTTAGNISDRDGEYAYNFMTSGAPWTEKFLDTKDEEELRYLVKNNTTGLKPMVYGAFNHRQLGRSDEWLYRKLQENNQSGEVADRDFMNIWSRSGVGSPMTEAEKKRVNSSKRPSDEQTFTQSGGYMIKWYVPANEIENRMASSRFIMGNDTSEGLGGDNDANGIVIMDAYTHDVVAVMRVNQNSIPELAGCISEILVKYPNITYIPERKNSALAILDYLFIYLPAKGIDPFRRIFNQIVDDPESHQTEWREIQRPVASRNPNIYKQCKRYFGFVTSGAGQHSRDQLYVDALKSMLKYGANKIYDEQLINELNSLIVSKNNRIDHKKGNHDDLVVSLLLCHWLCIRGKNLSYYGIDPLKVLSAAESGKEEISEVELFRRENNRRYQTEFYELMGELKEVKDTIKAMQIESRIRSLSMKLDTNELVGMGIDALIQQSREERQHEQHLDKMHRAHRRAPGRYNFAHYR